MQTGILEKDGLRIVYTVQGEQYRYAIFKGKHIIQSASGSGAEEVIQPTPERMEKALDQHVRLTRITRPHGA
jgi:hypothetical protein